MGVTLRVVVFAGLAVLLLKVLVWWLEPRMAFYPIRGVQGTPSAAGVSFVEVSIPTEDGETLHAWWLEHPSPRAQVVFFHGNGGNLSLWCDLLVEIRRRGFSVLAVDYRGYGASTGAPSERGLYRDADATLRVFGERLRQTRVPVVYWGRSVGTPVAAYAATRAAPDAVVLDSPFPEIGSILAGNPVLRLLHLFSSYSFPTSRFLQQYEGPLLVVHGDADSIVPFTAGKRVFEQARTTRKTFTAIPGADHNDLDVVNPALYWQAVDRFVDAVRVDR
jgi:fermentation-respiration switch protein FrsA (DUF1100 family)